MAFFLQHPFFAFLLQEDFPPPYLLLLLKLKPPDLLLLQEDFLLLEQLVFFLPLQHVPFALFLQVALHIFPVFTQTSLPSSLIVYGHLSVPQSGQFALICSTAEISLVASVSVCAFTLAIPIKSTANNTIDNFFIFNNF